MSTIWKTILSAVDKQTISVPQGARFLTVGAQGSDICLWFLCNPDNAPENRAIRIYGTGHEVPETPGEYIGTALLFDGTLVLHAFEPAP